MYMKSLKSVGTFDLPIFRHALHTYPARIYSKCAFFLSIFKNKVLSIKTKNFKINTTQILLLSSTIQLTMLQVTEIEFERKQQIKISVK